MSYSFKIVIDKRYIKENNTHPLKLRIYHGALYKEKSLGIFITATDWDDSNQVVLQSELSYEVYNSKILSKKSRVQKLLLSAELNEDVVISLDDIIVKVFNDVTPDSKIKKQTISIIKYGQDIIKQLTASGKVGNAFAYGCAVSKLKSFVNTDNFPQ